LRVELETRQTHLGAEEEGEDGGDEGGDDETPPRKGRLSEGDTVSRVIPLRAEYFESTQNLLS
jgi:hypothetical protein